MCDEPASHAPRGSTRDSRARHAAGVFTESATSGLDSQAIRLSYRARRASRESETIDGMTARLTMAMSHLAPAGASAKDSGESKVSTRMSPVRSRSRTTPERNALGPSTSATRIAIECPLPPESSQSAGREREPNTRNARKDLHLFT